MMNKLPCLALFSLVLTHFGCSTYTDVTNNARSAYYRGDLKGSATAWTGLLNGKGRKKDIPLMQLERGIVYLAMGKYRDSIRDLNAADQQLEIIDFSKDPKEIGKYLFSEDSGPYRGQPYEKILIPTLDLVNFAVLGDFKRAGSSAGAAYAQMARFSNLEKRVSFSSPLAYILLGIMEEIKGDTQRAYIAYDKAYKVGRYPILKPYLLHLLEENKKRFGGEWGRKLALRRREWGKLKAARPGKTEGELVVIVLNGKAPIRAEEKKVLTRNQRDSLTSQSMVEFKSQHPDGDQKRARVLFRRQRFLPMAVLAERPSMYTRGELVISRGSRAELVDVLPVANQIRKWYNAQKGKILAAALSRFAFRLAVRIGTHLAVEKKTGNQALASAANWLAGFTMKALDTPDTRCWTLLPKNILFQRQVIPAGKHTIKVIMRSGRGGRKKTLVKDVSIKPGGFTFVVFVVNQ